MLLLLGPVAEYSIVLDTEHDEGEDEVELFGRWHRDSVSEDVWTASYGGSPETATVPGLGRPNAKRDRRLQASVPSPAIFCNQIRSLRIAATMAIMIVNTATIAMR